MLVGATKKKKMATYLARLVLVSVAAAQSVAPCVFSALGATFDLSPLQLGAFQRYFFTMIGHLVVSGCI